MQGRPEVTRLGFRVAVRRVIAPCVVLLNHAATAGAYAWRHAGVDCLAMTMGGAIVNLYRGELNGTLPACHSANAAPHRDTSAAVTHTGLATSASTSAYASPRDGPKAP